MGLASNQPTTAAYCAKQQSIRSIYGLGRCQDDLDQFLCTSHKSACRRTLSFEGPARDCTLSLDLNDANNFPKPLFGCCAYYNNPGRDFCAWQAEECLLDDNSNLYSFTKADPALLHAHATSCKCNDVHVGACVSTQQGISVADNAVTYCAVTKEVCVNEPGFEYMSALKYQQKFKRSCRLCDSSDVVVTEAPPTTASAPSVAPPTSKPLQKLPTVVAAPSRSNTSQGQTGLVVGGTLGGLVLVGIVVTLLISALQGRPQRVVVEEEIVEANHDLEGSEEPLPAKDAVMT